MYRRANVNLGVKMGIEAMVIIALVKGSTINCEMLFDKAPLNLGKQHTILNLLTIS